MAGPNGFGQGVLYSLEVPTPFLISISGVSRHLLSGTDLALIPPILWVLGERNAPYNTSGTRAGMSAVTDSPAAYSKYPDIEPIMI